MLLSADTQWYRSGHNEHDWKSCVGQNLTEGSNPSHCAKKESSTRQGGAFLFRVAEGEKPRRASAARGARPQAGVSTANRRRRLLGRRREDPSHCAGTGLLFWEKQQPYFYAPKGLNYKGFRHFKAEPKEEKS